MIVVPVVSMDGYKRLMSEIVKRGLLYDFMFRDVWGVETAMVSESESLTKHLMEDFMRLAIDDVASGRKDFYLLARNRVERFDKVVKERWWEDERCQRREPAKRYCPKSQ